MRLHHPDVRVCSHAHVCVYLTFWACVQLAFSLVLQRRHQMLLWPYFPPSLFVSCSREGIHRLKSALSHVTEEEHVCVSLVVR